MRTFVVVSHTVPPSGDWGLDDLAGGAGRVDVLCRAVSSALFLSHGIREDTRVVLVFVSDPAKATAVRISGAGVQRLNPDERSTAARIRHALRARHPDPWWEEVEPGIEVAPFAPADVLGEPDGPVVVLDRDGTDVGAAPLPADATYVLSDHLPFTDAERDLLRAHAGGAVSLGPAWYHGHHAIGVLQWLVDRQAHAPQPVA